MTPTDEHSDAEMERGGRQIDGDELEAEARALVERFNDAKPSYSPDLEWFGMSYDRDTDEQQFVFESDDYIDSDGLSALRSCGRTIRYIEAYEFDGSIGVQIQLPVRGEVPSEGGPRD